MVYVDHIVIARNDAQAISHLTNFLNYQFLLKEFGKFKYFLGFDIGRCSKGIYVCQREYALEIIQDCGMLVAKRDKFPMESRTEGELLEETTSYQRPDLSYSVQILSQFMDNPRQPHFDAANRVVRYLKSSQGQGLFFPSSFYFFI